MAKSYISGHCDLFDSELWFCGLVGFSVETGDADMQLSKQGHLESGLGLAGCETPKEADISRYVVIYKDTYYTYSRKNREYIGEYIFSQDGSLLIDDWIVISKEEKIPGYRSVPKHVLFDLKSEKEIPLNGLFQFLCYARNFRCMLLTLKYYDSTAKSNWKLMLLDLEKGEIIWEKKLARLGFTASAISEKYVSVSKTGEEKIEVLDMESGELVRTLPFNGKRAFFVRGCVCMAKLSIGRMYHHIVESNVTYSKSYVELGCEGSYPKSGNKDIWVFYNDETSKLSIYNLEADRCNHYYFPVINLDENLNRVLDIRMVENKIRVIASIRPYNHAEFNRVYVFEEDELLPFEDSDNFNHWTIEEEAFVGDFNRVVIEGAVSYLIQFEHGASFSVLYRQLRSLLTIVGSEYGSTTHYIDKSTDTDWGGIIQVDLENQSLGEDDRKEIEMLRILMTHSIGAEYAAGSNPNKPINIEVSY